MGTAVYKVDAASDRRRRENVPRHILAPAAVACNIYLIRRSTHPRGAFFTLQESNFL